MYIHIETLHSCVRVLTWFAVSWCLHPECQGTSLAGQTLFPVGDVAKESGPRDYQDAWCSYDADTNEAREDV